MLGVKRRRQANAFNNNDLHLNNNNNQCNNNNKAAANKQFNELCGATAATLCAKHKNCDGITDEVCVLLMFFFFFCFLSPTVVGQNRN